MSAMEAIMPTSYLDLPVVRGSLSRDEPLSKLSWFRTGGAADIMFRPADAEDLCAFLAALPANIPVTAIGVGSNLIIRDGGVRGVVVRLGKPFSELEIEDDYIHAGAGAMDVTVSYIAREAELGGLEFLRGIPGTVGGAVRMNAGAYGREVADVLVEAVAVDRRGRRHTLGPDEMGFQYRGTTLNRDWIVISALFRGTPDSRANIERRMAEITSAREDTQPVRTRTGGSTFKNPPGVKAWALIDKAGCRGLTRGGAMVSEKHCNFLINMGEATSADLEALGEEVRRRVKDSTGITLEWEIERIGEFERVGL